MAHPRMYDDSNPAIQRLREVCLGLGDVVEKEAWGECTFRAVGGSMFAMTDNDHHSSGHIAVWVKAPEMVQEILVNSCPRKFFKPPYVGHRGWVGVRLEGNVDWDELAGILTDGYLMSAPKKLRVAAPSGVEKTAVAKRKRSAKSPARRR
jgi:hypothetical protein